MTKKRNLKIAAKKASVSSDERSAEVCECEKGACSCGCNCQGTKVAILAGTALAIVLSVVACIKSCTCDMAGSDAAIEAYIKANPKVILDSVEAYHQEQEKNRPAPPPQVAPAELIAKIVADKTNYSLGNPKGKFVIIEFFDHQCGWCKRTNDAMRAALAKPEAKNIRWIPIDTPIFGEASETIARYVLAAGKQGKYAAMHKAVGESKERLDEEKLIALGEKIGLDGKKLKADANGDAIKNKLIANREFTRALNINGVPMLIVNGKINPGALFGEALDAVVAESAQ